MSLYSYVIQPYGPTGTPYVAPTPEPTATDVSSGTSVGDPVQSSSSGGCGRCGGGAVSEPTSGAGPGSGPTDAVTTITDQGSQGVPGDPFSIFGLTPEASSPTNVTSTSSAAGQSSAGGCALCSWLTQDSVLGLPLWAVLLVLFVILKKRSR